MFHWICPECGREIPPAVKECAACDPKARLAPVEVAPRVEKKVEAPEPPDPLLAMAEMIRSAQAAVRLDPKVELAVEAARELKVEAKSEPSELKIDLKVEAKVEAEPEPVAGPGTDSKIESIPASEPAGAPVEIEPAEVEPELVTRAVTELAAAVGMVKPMAE